VNFLRIIFSRQILVLVAFALWWKVVCLSESGRENEESIYCLSSVDIEVVGKIFYNDCENLEINGEINKEKKS